MTRDGTLVNLLLVSREGLLSGMEVGVFLEHSDHELTEFLILGKVRGGRSGWRGRSRTTILDFKKIVFGLLRRLVGRVSWEAVLKSKG